jgi:predicted nucleic acid-binding protein
MSGIKFLLDTNIILGLMKSSPEVLVLLSPHGLTARQCAYSVITRIELLGFPGIKPDEDALIRQRLEKFTCLALAPEVEDMAILLRRTRKVKLPDALIAATALSHGLTLLTLDQGLNAVAAIGSPMAS